MSGVLLHLTSLPSPCGIGDMGPEAFRFVDFLVRTGQSVWQVLPLNPTCLEYGNSPYYCPSVFAGNTLLVSPELLVGEGYLTGEEAVPSSPPPDDEVEYEEAVRFKESLFSLAFDRFRERAEPEEYGSFCRSHGFWLDDYALFKALREDRRRGGWTDWPPELRDRDGEALAEAKAALAPKIEREKFLQFLFFRQWDALRRYASERGVSLFGDLPIYPTFDSADVWANPSLFKLGEDRRPLAVAGVPPDYFSETGQLWGNPLYDWKAHEEGGFSWWIRRVRHNLSLFDFLRIDHFRGLVACWEVPAGETTSVNGSWAAVPAQRFLQALFRTVPADSIIAEDLGTITEDVTAVRRRFGIPGMKVLQFAFGDEGGGNPYLPHNYWKNSVVYTGTHDNNTVRGWFEHEADDGLRQRVFRYAGHGMTADTAPESFIRMAMRSVAGMVIIPMQDHLALGGESRMNRPSTTEGNWRWRMNPGAITEEVERNIGEMTVIYGRGR